MKTFVVERYWPGISATEAATVMASEADHAAEMRREGTSVRVLRSTLVEDDETLLSLVEAASREDVVELGRRAGAPPDRIVPAVEMTPGDLSQPGGESPDPVRGHDPRRPPCA